MFEEAYEDGLRRALSDAGVTKTATPRPGRLARLLTYMGEHPEGFGALGGSGLGAGTTAWAGGDLGDILLGAGAGAMAGGVSGMGARAIRNAKVNRTLLDRINQLELKKELTMAGHPPPSAEEILADRAQLEAKIEAGI